jgi:hypothetical protein
METYQMEKETDSEGKITITGLPPSSKMTIFILPCSEEPEWRKKMERWMGELRKEKLFEDMSKNEILELLKKNRLEVWEATRE